MKKSSFKRLLDVMFRRSKHVSKSKAFSYIRPNPAGSKFRKRCLPTAGRRVDGTLRSDFTARLRSF